MWCGLYFVLIKEQCAPQDSENVFFVCLEDTDMTVFNYTKYVLLLYKMADIAKYILCQTTSLQ